MEGFRMNTEFSLLKHLGVTVDNCEPSADRVLPTPSEGKAFRVWAPTQRPPSKCGSAEETCRVLDKRRQGPHPSYADPTGEVRLRRKNGVEVQYIVYNSKIPSVYGINKRLAEKKKLEKEREKNSALADYGLELGEDEAREEEARRELLRELRRCNEEQVRLKKEEERRERERRVAHERIVSQHSAAEAAREEEAICKKMLEEAVDAAAEQPTRREAARAGATEDMRGAASFWDGMDEDDRRRVAATERARQLAEENFRVAEQRHAERKAEEQAERERAQAELTELQRQLTQEHAKDVERHRRNAEALRRAQEAERERLCREDAVAHSQVVPSGSLFDAMERRERIEALRSQQKQRENMTLNARLAAEKRASAQAERDRERQSAAEYAKAELEKFQREVERARQRRQNERLQQEEAAAAAAKARQAQADAARHKEPSSEAFLFWPASRTPRAEEAKTTENRRFHEDLRRDAEKKRNDCAQKKEEERARDRALIEYDTRSAQEAAARERKEAREKAEDLRRTLEAQIAQKRRKKRRDAASMCRCRCQVRARYRSNDSVPLPRDGRASTCQRIRFWCSARTLITVRVARPQRAVRRLLQAELLAPLFPFTSNDVLASVRSKLMCDHTP
ncbi:hypothetical protein JIQ42_08307 [Leishmania sp. Namibia]|uniref:hypothetical protein n=1 Tax=Leishmania sp. Namibia TaxID=2802991 RepID=UPI001B60DCF3|nr:hypothetical protein JIQ42_08307 [Leishmania sp. Namibia]